MTYTRTNDPAADYDRYIDSLPQPVSYDDDDRLLEAWSARSRDEDNMIVEAMEGPMKSSEIVDLAFSDPAELGHRIAEQIKNTMRREIAA